MLTYVGKLLSTEIDIDVVANDRLCAASAAVGNSLLAVFDTLCTAETGLVVPQTDLPVLSLRDSGSASRG